MPGSYISNSQVTIISSVSRDTSKWKIKYEKSTSMSFYTNLYFLLLWNYSKSCFLVCGVKYFNSTGSFDSPSRSSQKLDCIYQIEQPIGYIIELTMKVAMDSIPFGGSSCMSGYVEVSIYFKSQRKNRNRSSDFLN